MRTRPTPSAPQPLTDRPWMTALAAGVIVLGALAAYHNSLSGPFIFDDQAAILENPTLREGPLSAKVWGPPADTTVTGRPLANLTFALNFAIGGYGVRGYHVFNLLVHLASGLTLFGLLRRTLRRAPWGNAPAVAAPPVAPPARRHSRAGRAAPAAPVPFLKAHSCLVALTIALCWTLHPLNTEAVTYVVQRVESLMGLFFLLTFYCFLRAVDSPPERGWQAAAVVACLLGVATKEIVALVPILLPVFDRTFVAGSFAEGWRRRRWFYLTLAATWLPLVGLVATAGWNRNSSYGVPDGSSLGVFWLSQLEAIARYLQLALWPHPLVFEYGTISRIDPLIAFGCAAIVVPVAVVTLVALRRWPVAGFLGAWFFGILAPTSLLPGKLQMIVEHRMYLPLAAVLTLLIGAAAERWGRRALAAGLALAVAGGGLTAQRNEVYRSAESVWNDTLARRPDNERAYNCLGAVLLANGQPVRAITNFEAALRRRPTFLEARNNLGFALTRAGRLPEAIAELERVLRVRPDYPAAHNNLGNALLASHRPAEAIAHYREALRLRPDGAKMHFNLGNALTEAGRLAEAMTEFETAGQLNPFDADARFNLGNLLVQSGRLPEAITRYREVLDLAPAYAEAHNNLGHVYLELDNLPEAIAAFAAAVRARPGYAQAHNNLSVAFGRAGRIAEAVRECETAVRLQPDYADAQRNLEHWRAVLRPPAPPSSAP